MIRLYTPEQIGLFIQQKMDKSFQIEKYLDLPKQVKISDKDIDELIKPVVNKSRKRLF